MDLKNIVTKESYQIEATPLGRYIARPNNPALETIEGATKEDVERQIDAKIESSVEQALPESFGKFGLTGHRTTTKISYRIEEKPEGGFIARPSDPAMGILEGVSKEEVQQLVQEKMRSLLGQQIPDLSANPRNINMTVNSNVRFRLVSQNSSGQQSNSQPGLPPSGGHAISVSLNVSSLGRIVRFVITVIVVSALVYFWRHR
jgi:hypothetical protein